MNENKTAITQMREWLENEDALVEEKHIDLLYLKILDKARALESSQAERDKGLVEGLNEVLHTPCLFTDSWRVVERAKEILSRHQSTPIDPDYDKHIVEEGSRKHVVHYDSNGAHCSEPNCEMNKPLAPKPEAKTEEGVERNNCPSCGGQGWYPSDDGAGNAIQEQCAHCRGQGFIDVMRPATLEPLAAKMAYDKEWLYEVSSSGGFYWRIMLRPRTIKQGAGVDLYGHTYPECEAKALKYLESLPTKGEEQKEGKV